MLVSGNGAPEVCADNLLKLRRGEVPMDRIRGIDAALIDAPISESADEISADAEWVLETWEPRIEVNEVIAGWETETGRVSIKADISVSVAEDEEEDGEDE